MSMINQYVKYVNIGLAVIAVIVLLVLLIKLLKLKPTVGIIADDTGKLTKNLDGIDNTLTTIKATEKSWVFFSSLYVIFVIIKETFKYAKANKSISKSLTKSVTRHAKQLSSIRF